MSYCGSIIGTWGNPPVFQIQTLALNPADLGTCSRVLMTGAEYTAALQLAAANASGSGTGSTVQEPPFDSQIAGQFFAFGFTVVVTLYLTAHVIGLVLKFVRDN